MGSNSAKCNNELAIGENRVRKIQCTFSMTVTLAPIDCHYKCWFSRDFHHLKLEQRSEFDGISFPPGTNRRIPLSTLQTLLIYTAAHHWCVRVHFLNVYPVVLPVIFLVLISLGIFLGFRVCASGF